MLAFNAPAFTAVIIAISGVTAYRSNPISGHDFDFAVVYPSGLTFSTMQPPTDILPASDIGATEPLVTLADPDGATGRDDRYVAFVEISYQPAYDSVDDAIYEFPWIESNLTVGENGTLTPDPLLHGASHIGYFHTIWTCRPRRRDRVRCWRQRQVGPQVLPRLLMVRLR
ncbi:hypothetical protein GGR53DRAFT_401053 [Hypoxylon sp. FL1150]|nr:hypothetical protein GGR53DRAFT_401053 [Hypoxylon sp. FL1150]